MPANLRQHFLLNPDIVFLNHGSFGATPQPVFDAYQSWQRELERQPVEFLGRRVFDLLRHARARLAAYVGAAADEVVYFPNPTTALNAVIRALELNPGDEILTSDHEYGALVRTWRFYTPHTGAVYLPHPIPMPVTTHADFVDRFWQAVTDRTRVIFLSHITSPTGLIFPVAEICRRARAAGILTIVDGAHTPGQIPLNLTELGCDIFSGACHKWLMAPKGAAFLYARRDVQAWIDPLVVSWGWESDWPVESEFIGWHEWQGTRDVAAFLSVPAAIDFQAAHGWDQVRADCRTLARTARERVNTLTGLDPVCPASDEWLAQLALVRMPAHIDPAALKTRLYDDFRIEIPVITWNNEHFLRISIQGYNTPADVDALVGALQHLL